MSGRAAIPAATDAVKGHDMKTSLLLALGLALAPALASALPAVGDVVGTNPTDAGAALAAAGCTVDSFESEDGMIEAKCHDAEARRYEVYIDPATGTVAKVERDD
jgi:hypothetical protein